MKTNFLLLIFGVVAFIGNAQTVTPPAASQEVWSIPSGYANAGYLDQAIKGDLDGDGNRLNPNRIYFLEPGVHFYKTNINVANDAGTIKIHGDTSGSKPVLLPWAEGGVGGPSASNITSSLEIKNVHILGRRNTGATTGGYIFIVKGNNRSIHIEDCLVEFPARFIKAQDVPIGLNITMRNNYFRDFWFEGQQWAGNVIDAKYKPIESLIFENNTVSNSGCPILLQGQVVKYALFNHNTFINTSTYWNLNHYFYEGYFTNNLFYNANMMGEDYNYLQSNPDDLPFPIMAFDQIDPVNGTASTAAIPADMWNGDAENPALVAPYNDISNYKIYVADNIYFNESSLDNYYAGNYNSLQSNPISYINWHSTPGPHKVDVPALWMGQREIDLFANNSNWIEENNLFTDPSLATVALDNTEAIELAKWMRKMYAVPEESETVPDMTSYLFGDFDSNTIQGSEIEVDQNGAGITKFTDLIEDFSIGASFVSTIDGLPIGALHWTNAIDSYDYQVGLQAIESSYNTSLSINDEVLKVSNIETFPNPFGNTLSINLNIASNAKVDVSLYTITGAKVMTLSNGLLDVGDHNLEFNTTSLSKGLYLCKIEAGQYTKTFKVIKSE